MRIRQRDSLRVAPAALWLILPPIVVFAAGDLLQLWIGWNLEVKLPDPWTFEVRKEAVGRLTMMAAFIAAIAVGFAAVFVYASDLFRLFGSVSRRRLLAASAIALALLLGWVAVTATLTSLPDIMHYPGQSFVENALKRAGADLPAKLWTINMIVRVAFVLGGIGVIVGTISCLAEPMRSRPPWARRALRRLQQRRLRRYLNLAAAVMTAGLLFMVAWMRWPGFIYSGPEHAAYVAHVNALALYFGVYYSAIIASYYIPVSAILQNREATMLLGKDSQSTSEGVVDHRSTEVVGKGLALLVPALAGVAPSILELLRAGAGG